MVFFNSGGFEEANVSAMKFNWAELKREQKQAIFLIALWVFGGVFALYQFILVPYLRDRTESAGELEKLNEQILRAQVAMKGEPKVRADYRAAMAQYDELTRNFIVPVENPLAWVQDKVYRVARETGVSITSVSPAGAPSQVWENLVKKERFYKPFVIRIVAECGFPELVALVGTLESINPFLAVTGIIVAGQDQWKTRHIVTLTLEMPMIGRQPEFYTLRKKSSAESEKSRVRQTVSAPSAQIQ